MPPQQGETAKRQSQVPLPCCYHPWSFVACGAAIDHQQSMWLSWVSNFTRNSRSESTASSASGLRLVREKGTALRSPITSRHSPSSSGSPAALAKSRAVARPLEPAIVNRDWEKLGAPKAALRHAHPRILDLLAHPGPVHHPSLSSGCGDAADDTWPRHGLDSSCPRRKSVLNLT
jgi:hypothetical protein